MTALGHRVSRAHQVHVCDYCQTEIPAGSIYERWLWADGDDTGPVKVHRGCDALASAYYASVEAWPGERWVEWAPIQAFIDDQPEEALGMLLAMPLEERGRAWAELQEATP